MNIHIGTIKPLDLLKGQRRPAIEKTGGAHSSKKGKRGYDRKRDKRAGQRGDD